MEAMSKTEVQTLDNETLLNWLTFLSRFRAEDIGLHVDTDGKWASGDKRPTLEDVEDELVRRGLDDGPKVKNSEGTIADENSDSRGLW